MSSSSKREEHINKYNALKKAGLCTGCKLPNDNLPRVRCKNCILKNKLAKAKCLTNKEYCKFRIRSSNKQCKQKALINGYCNIHFQ